MILLAEKSQCKKACKESDVGKCY